MILVLYKDDGDSLNYGLYATHQAALNAIHSKGLSRGAKIKVFEINREFKLFEKRVVVEYSFETSDGIMLATDVNEGDEHD